MGKGGNKSFKGAKWLLEYLPVIPLVLFIRLIPFRLALSFGGLLGSLAYRIDKRHRRVTEDNLRQSFKEKGPEEITGIARGVYRNFGYSVIEFIRSGRYGRHNFDRHFTLTNFDAYLKALDKGKGILLLTGHCGSWELMALAQSMLKFPIGVVVRPLDNPYLERAVSRLRTRHGNTMINKTRGMREILKVIAAGGGVGILLDQSVSRKEGVFVDFFGRPACTNKGLALIAMKTKTPVVPAFIRRIDKERHEILVGDEIPLVETGDKEADVLANTRAYTRAIEDFIRKYPDQWFWMHRRWKTKPEEPGRA